MAGRFISRWDLRTEAKQRSGSVPGFSRSRVSPLLSPRIVGVTADRRLDAAPVACHAIHMKRTNLVLDAALLEETLKVSRERTYSRAVERAMEDFVRRARARQILELA